MITKELITSLKEDFKKMGKNESITFCTSICPIDCNRSNCILLEEKEVIDKMINDLTFKNDTEKIKYLFDYVNNKIDEKRSFTHNQENIKFINKKMSEKDILFYELGKHDSLLEILEMLSNWIK